MSSKKHLIVATTTTKNNMIDKNSFERNFLYKFQSSDVSGGISELFLYENVFLTSISSNFFLDGVKAKG